jgi:hypothetical protein
MRFLAVLAAASLLGASFASQDQDPYAPGAASGLPWYKPEEVLKGKVPYIAVYRYDLFQSGLKNPQARVPYEWHLPLSTLEGSRAVALDLIRAWQRLEERTYWHVLSRINYQFGASQARCFANDLIRDWFKGAFRADKPEAKVGVAPEHLPSVFNPPLALPPVASDGTFRMEWYTYFYGGGTALSSSEYCDDLGNGDLPIYPYMPGFCVKALGLKFCTPGYPDPLYLDMAEFKGRARRGMEHAAKAYIPDYEKDVLNAVKPRGDLMGFANALSQGSVRDPEIFAPTDWSGALLGSGALLTPVVRLVGLPKVKDDLEAVWKAIRDARYADGDLNKVKELYFVPSLQALLSRAGLGGILALPQVAEGARVQVLSLFQGSKYRSQVARGIWPLEELKRWFPPSRPEVHEALGYTTYFQVFGKLDFTPLPDPGARWSPGEYAGVSFVRSLHIWNVPLIIDYDNPVAVIVVPFPPFVIIIPSVYPDFENVRPIFIPPYVIFYAGPRYYYDWVSVPEGYPIPRVKGTPLSLPFSR